LFIKKGAPFRPFICGGHQEHNRRGGTENVFGIWAWANAAKVVSQGVIEKRKATCRARDIFEEKILIGYQGAEINGNRNKRLCNTSNIYFPGIENSAFLILLDQNGLMASSGSACLTDSTEPSHVIKAMKGAEAANQSLRFSFSLQTNEKEAEEAACIVLRVAKELNF
jgi:cysteine desulfurase